MNKHICLLHFSIIMSHNVLSGTTMLEDQDQGRSETGLVIRPQMSQTPSLATIGLFYIDTTAHRGHFQL